MVITRTTRNRFVLSRARGFESHHLRQEKRHSFRDVFFESSVLCRFFSNVYYAITTAEGAGIQFVHGAFLLTTQIPKSVRSLPRPADDRCHRIPGECRRILRCQNIRNRSNIVRSFRIYLQSHTSTTLVALFHLRRAPQRVKAFLLWKRQ